MVSRVFTYAAMVFVPIVNVRALSVEHYGYYRQFHLLFETLAPVLILGFPLSLQYYLPRAESDREKSAYVTQTLVFLFIGAVLAIAIYSVLGKTLGSGMGGMIRSFYWRLCAFTGLMMMTDYMESLFAAERQYGRQAMYHAVFMSLQSITVMALAWMYRDVSAMIWGLTAYALVRFLYTITYTIVRYRPSFSLLSLATIREQLSFALPMGVFATVLILLNQTDKFIINRFMGRAAFAIYAVGAFQLPFANMISMSVRSVTFPLMVQKQKAGDLGALVDVWQRAAVKMAILYFPMFVYFEVVAQDMVRVLFTPTYADASPIFMMYLLLLPQLTTDSVAIIQAFKNTRYLLGIYTIAFVANVLLSLGLYRLIGRVGVPLGTVITIYATNVINMIFSSRRCQVRFRSFVPLRQLGERFVAAIVPGIPLWWFVKRYSTDNIFALAALGIAYFALYFAICRAAGLVTLDDIRSLMGRTRESP